MHHIRIPDPFFGALRAWQLIGLATLLLTGSSSMRAASGQWTGATDSNWISVGNWTASPVPGTGDTATFNSAGNGNRTLSLGAGGVTINTILFDTANAGAYTIGTGAVGSQTLTLNNGGAITINSTVTNDQLINANVVLGTASASASYTLTNSSMTKTLTLAGNIVGGATTGTKTLAVAGAGNTLIGGAIGTGSGTIALTKTGAGKLTLTGTNTFTGAVTLTQGTLNIQNSSALGTTAGGVSISSGYFQLEGGITVGNEALSLSSSWLESMSGTNNYGGLLTFGGSGNRVFSHAGTLNLTNTGAISGSGSVVFDGPGDGTVSGDFGANVFPDINSGTWTFLGVNANTAATMAGGTLRLSGTGRIGSTDVYLAFYSGTIDLNGTSQSIGEVFNGGDANAFVLNNGTGTSTFTIGTGNNFGQIFARLIDNNNAGSGVLAVTKAGTGTFALSGANSYSGLTTISAGILEINHATALGSTAAGTTISVAGGTLQISGGITVGAEPLTIRGAGAAAATGALQNVSGTNSFGGLLTLAAASTISSDAGTLNLTNTGTITGATFALTLAGAGNGSIAGVIGTTTGGVTISSTGTWTLSGANTFTGALNVSGGGTLVVPTVNNASTAGPLGNSATAVTLNGTLEYTGGTASSTKPFALSTSGTFQIDSAATELTLSGLISGVGDALIKTGPGTLTLTAANTYSGGTTIVFPGTLKLSGSGRLGATTGALVMQNGRLDLGGTDQTVGSLNGFGTIVNNGGGASVLTVNTSSANDAYGNFIFDNDNATAGTVGLTKSGTGTLTLALGGTSNYSGAVLVTNGILVAGSFDALGSAAGATIVSSGATLRIQSVGVLAAEPIEISGVGETGTDGALEGTAATYTGLLKLNAASTIAAIGAFPEFPFDLTNPGTITGATFTLTLAGTSAGSIASIIGTTSGGLTKSDTGTWTLTGANTYTGATTINAGILNIQNDTATGTTAGGVSVINGATLQIEGDIAVGAELLTIRGVGAAGTTGALQNVSGDNTWAGLLSLALNSTISSDAGTLNLTNTGIINDLFDLTLTGAGDGSLASVIATGANTVTKTGAGKWTLTGANTFTLALTIQDGTLSVPTFNNASAAGPLGSSALAVTLGATSQTGTIEYTGASATSSKAFNLAGGGGVFDIALAGTELTLTGAISGAGSLEKAGLGTLTFASSKAFMGSTLVSEGTLKLTVLNAIVSTAGIVVETGGVLLLAGTPADSRIADTNPLTLSGGTLSTEGLSNASEIFGTFSLTLANSTIDFGSGSGNALTFGGVGTHTAGIKLALLNWSGTPNVAGTASSDRLIFTGATSAFTGVYAQADVSFNGVNGYLALNLGGGQYEIVAVPEPASALLFCTVGLGMFAFRRRSRAAK